MQSMIERHSLIAWPGLAQRRIGGWALAFGGGHTKRANSASLQSLTREPATDALPAIMDAYANQGLPPIFRVTPLAIEAGVDEHLNLQNFIAFDHTRVQFLDLAVVGATLSKDPEASISAQADPAWRSALARMQGLQPDSARLQGLILDRIEGETIYAELRGDGVGVAWGMGVVSGGLLGLFNIVTAPERRGQGHGGRLVRAILAAGVAAGATQAYLQVGVGNQPALGLYERIGFRDSYQYHYRRPA